MSSENIKYIADKSIGVVKNFIAGLPDNDKEILPSVLKKDGIWFGNFDDYSIGIFYITNGELQRIKGNINKGLSAFPGFFVSDHNRPKNIPIAIMEEGSCNYFASNHTTNIIAFDICPRASFIVIDHFHELKDSSGQEFKYRVDLAFFLGILPDEQWGIFELRLLELLQHSLNVWRSIR